MNEPPLTLLVSYHDRRRGAASPFQGHSPAITEVVSGRASMTFGAMVPTLPFVKSGRLWPLGVASPTRNPRYPEFPTMAESGLPGYEAQGFNGLCGPLACRRTSSRK